jgi:hypothetical protein
MPVEVRELVIRATITGEDKQGSSGGSAADGQAAPNEELIKICVDKILEILKERHER